MRRFSLFLAVTALGALPAALYGATILSENFDELTPGTSHTSVGAFTAIGGTNVDVVGNVGGSFFPSLCVAPESGNCIDMDGTGGISVATLQSNLSFTTGTYLLSFDLIGSRRGSSSSVTVTLGSYSQTFVLASTDVTSGIVVDAVATVTGPSHLVFTSNDPSGDQSGALLDNVLVTSSSTSSVPEPSSTILVGSGVLLCGFVLRGRRLAR